MDSWVFSVVISSGSQFSKFKSLSHVQLFATPWTAAHQASLSITSSWGLLKLMSIKLVMPSNHLILFRPLLLSPSIFPSIRVFSSESALHIGWPKYWTVVNRYQWLHPRYWSGTGASPGGCGFEWIAALVVAVQSLSRV